jgi:hypothetical protein
MAGLLVKSAVGVGALVAFFVALKLLLGVVGMVFSVASFVLFTVLPLAIIGWVVMKIVRHFRRRPAYD